MNSYAVEQRMRMIDFLLASYGYVAPRYLADYFGISKPQSSLDFRLYNEQNPGNMTYLHGTMCWCATDVFKRAYP